MVFPYSQEFNKVKKLTDAGLRFASHLDFLKQAQTYNIVPKGFEIKWKNMVDKSSEDIKLTEDTLECTSKQLINQTVSKLEIKLTETKIAINIGLSRLKQSHAKSEYKEILNRLSNFERKYYHNLKQRKRKKLSNLRRGNQKAKSKQNSVKIIETEPDGNCYFRSLSQAIFNHQNEHKVIRSKIINELRKNKKDYEIYIDGDYAKHLQDMESTGGAMSSWATEAEIYATTRVYKQDVFIRTKVLDNYEWARFSSNDVCDHTQPFITLAYANNHFNYVQTSNRPCKCEKLGTDSISISQKSYRNKKNAEAITEYSKNTRPIKSLTSEENNNEETENVLTSNRFSSLWMKLKI